MPGGKSPASSNLWARAIAAKPTRDPVSPDDLLATVYHLLGIDHQQEIYDLAGRPFALVDGEPVTQLIA